MAAYRFSVVAGLAASLVGLLECCAEVTAAGWIAGGAAAEGTKQMQKEKRHIRSGSS